MIRTNAMYLLFRHHSGASAYMPADELVECGTPIVSSIENDEYDGEDMEYYGFTTNYNDAIRFINGEV